MVRYVTVSAKISRELYEKLKKHGVPVSRVIKRALEEEVRRREEEEVKRLLGEASKHLRKLSEEEVVESIRRSREER